MGVVATPELSLETRRWCFLVAGCVPYRGYFQREAAEKFAGALRNDGFGDGGFFSDPRFHLTAGGGLRFGQDDRRRDDPLATRTRKYHSASFHC